MKTTKVLFTIDTKNRLRSSNDHYSFSKSETQLLNNSRDRSTHVATRRNPVDTRLPVFAPLSPTPESKHIIINNNK